MQNIKLLVLTLPLLNACSINRAPSENLLEKRSDYEGVHQIEDALQAVDNPLLVPVRTEPLVADIWVHPHELASGDYFRGAWIRTIVSRSIWRMDEKQESLVIKASPKDEQRKGESHGK